MKRKSNILSSKSLVFNEKNVMGNVIDKNIVSELNLKTSPVEKYLGTNDSKPLKMYILIHEDVPPNYAIVAAAHASLACFRQYEDDPMVQDWIAGVFYKVVVKANDKEWAKAKLISQNTIITESRLGGKEMAIAFKPRWDYPDWFKYLPLWNV